MFEGITNTSFKFTTSKLDKLPIPLKGTSEFSDTDIPKLRIRVNAGGTKTFFLQKKIDGRTRHTIGVYPDIQPDRARELAINMLDGINQGVDPTVAKAVRAKKSATLQNILDQYIDTHPSLKPSTAKDYRNKMSNGFNDWLSTPISNFTRDMVAERHHWITNNKGKTTANNCARVLKAVCSYAEANEIISASPTSIYKAARLMHKIPHRTRIITSDELPLWYKAVSELDNKKASVYLLTLLYTGFRLSEALTLRWSQVDMKYKNFTLLDTKNRTDKSFPITEDLYKHLVELHKLTAHNEWVFPSNETSSHMTNPAKPLASLDKILGVHITPHDVRRTFTTISSDVGNPHHLTQRLTNHTAGNDITSNYIQPEDDALRKASEKIANAIQNNLNRSGNVIPFNQYG